MVLKTHMYSAGATHRQEGGGGGGGGGGSLLAGESMQPEASVPETLHLVAAVVDMQDDRERELRVADAADHIVH